MSLARCRIVFEVNVPARSVQPFAELVGPERLIALERTAREINALLGARAVWNVSSTAAGGGVAEMLRSILRYARGLGVQARWLVVEGPPAFFRITKRLHNALHDLPGDGSPLGPEQHRLYESVLGDNAAALDALVQPGDVVICHDPQTAGLVPHLVERGARVVWRCHIGHDGRGAELDRGWEFLRRYVDAAPIAVFSLGAYAPAWIPRARAVVLAPTIDPFSAKNEPLDDATVRAILCRVGLVEGPALTGAPMFTREDGSVGRVDRPVETLRLGPPPSWQNPLVVQVSRWDRAKDPRGVLDGFVKHVASKSACRSELVLAGPQMRSVADDPEGPQVFAEVEAAWRALPDPLRKTVHLAQLPMEDTEENAVIVNALQRHAAIIVQKSLREGFGLTVAEGMWKRRPVVASAVGGIREQIRDGVDGILLQDPTDLAELGRALCRVLDDEAFARRLGDAAYERVLSSSLSISSIEQWAALLRSLLAPSDSRQTISTSTVGSMDRRSAASEVSTGQERSRARNTT
jgi:trehalose synthase